ncbi:hypothetical protein P692DRAFT_20825452 [Suillus brevipes Sb2]|nr:hypothetical protein P692DRAFT_20825452 [Suillus brevipes Sb2]
MLVSSIFFIISAILPFTVGGTHRHMQRGRHQELAQRARGDVGIHKRSFDNSRFTFYDVGLGACGQSNSPDDFIVALNVAQYGGGYPGPHCFKSITILYGGKTAQATVMDKCMGCPYGGLDFSTGLFDYFAAESDGVLYGSWWFNDVTGSETVNSKWTPTPVPRADPSTATTYTQYHHYAADTNTTSTISTSDTSTTSTSETPTTSATDTSTTSTSETPTTSATDTSTTSTSETPTTSLTGTSTTTTSMYSSTSKLTAYVTARA